jgi:hypothetical protein
MLTMTTLHLDAIRQIQFQQYANRILKMKVDEVDILKGSQNWKIRPEI